jgi:hypothetical protein
VVPNSGKLNQDAALPESGHPVADALLCLRGSLTDHRSQMLQKLLDGAGEIRDIGVDINRFFVSF